MITSRDNGKLKFARSARDGKDRDHIFIEGSRLAEEALRSGVNVVEILVNEDLKLNETLERILNKNINNTPTTVDKKVFTSIVDTANSQGIIIIGKRPVNGLERIEQRLNTSAIPVVLYLQETNNPSNIGAIFRTAEAAGGAGVIISPKSADAFSPKAMRAAMGANLRLPVVENVELDTVLNWSRDLGLISTGADINATISYTAADWKTPRLLIFGSEAHGLPETERAKIEEMIKIPMENNVESLNIAVSAGIILFEARRQAGS